MNNEQADLIVTDPPYNVPIAHHVCKTKHEEFEMNNIFDIMDRNFKLITGVGKDGGYHAQIFMGRLFSQMLDEACAAGIV